MKFPKWIQRALDALPEREAVIAETEAKAKALQLVECLGCKGGRTPDLTWIESLDGPVISCLNCFSLGKIVKK